MKRDPAESPLQLVVEIIGSFQDREEGIFEFRLVEIIAKQGVREEDTYSVQAPPAHARRQRTGSLLTKRS